MEPDSSYATLWWIFGMLGIGFGLMISPLTAAVLSATPPTRVGLGSSVNNTSRQVGGALGVAVLGTFVLQQFTSNITSQLTQVGVPGPLGATIASRIATAGAQASQIRLSGRLPFPPATLHQAINQAFVDALHGSFLITGIIMLVIAVLVAYLLWQKQPATQTSEALTTEQVLTSVSSQPQVQMSAQAINRNRALLGMMLALVARRAQEPEADPTVLSALSSTVNGRYPHTWSEEERGRAVARDVIEPLSILLLTSFVNSEVGSANGGASSSSEMVPDGSEMPSSGHLK
jgi:hypothetical protein